jgi:hypothetical protein
MRTTYLSFALSAPMKGRLHRLGSLALSSCGAIFFNFSFVSICAYMQYLLLQVFLDHWTRSEEEEDYLYQYFLDGYAYTPDDQWLPLQVTLGYILFQEMFTFGLYFPYSSFVSSYLTPFYDSVERYEAVLQPSSPPHPSSHSTPNRSGRLFLEVEDVSIPAQRQLSRRQHFATLSPAPPPQNPMYSPNALSSQNESCESREKEDITVQAYAV